MIVVGGAYDEVCADPPLHWTFGSGVRAAAILGDRVERVVTAVDANTLERVRAVLGGTDIEYSKRAGPVTFMYETPLSRPQLYRDSRDSDLVPPDARGTNAVVFGMVESMPRVVAERAVVDSQHSLSLDEISVSVNADDLVIVANHREVRHLVGDPNSVTAARSILKRTGATAVVVKAGAAGALVVTDGASVGVPAVPTDRVFPIGSGDVFTASFAAAYFDGASPVEAAATASTRTAGYCATRQLRPVTISPILALDPPTPDTILSPPQVYVAASFNTPEQRWSARTAARGIDDVGGSSFYPLRDVGPVVEQASTARADLDALAKSGCVLVLADTARTGPFFEAGWATHAGIPVVIAASDPDPTRFTMPRGSGATVVHDLSTAVYHSVWQALRGRGQIATS